MRFKHLLFIFSDIILIVANNIVVKLPLGSVFGSKSWTNQNVAFFSFKKIPYAQPPLGHLRFQAPEPIRAWEDIKNCSHIDVVCYQLTPSNYQESEDCLYLNIYTPKLPNGNKEPLVPVMFFIHGGGFNDASSIPYHPDNFINHGVILVTINYRLGPFGFLSTGDSIIPGNNGLKDQHLALKWVQNYIRYFGGDNRKVTIFGHSAGSASVGYHLLNPKSENLFWAAICQSGSPLSTWAYQRTPKDTAFKFAEFWNTNLRNSETLLQFLQAVPADEISEAAKRFNDNIFNGTVEDFASLQGLSWAPTLEVESKNAFISRKMYELMKEGQFVKVPLMIGFTTEENLNFHFDEEELKRTAKQYDANLSNLVPVDMPNSENRTSYGLRIRNYYTNGSEFSKCLGKVVTFSSDNDMTRPITKFAELFSKFAPTFFYVFSYDGPTGNYNVYYDGSGKVGHGEELFYMFPGFTNTSNASISDITTKERLLTIWTNFAKFQNPTPEPVGVLQNMFWPTVKTKTESTQVFSYLEIGENLVVRKSTPKAETYKMWNDLYSELGEDDLATF